MKLAVPSMAPGGLDAQLSAHFGHCDVFTIVTLEDGKTTEVALLPNAGHESGGCMSVVMYLKDAGADAIAAGGMGARPLAGFQQTGITVYFNEGAATVGQAAALVANDTAQVFGPAQVCGGGGGECQT